MRSPLFLISFKTLPKSILKNGRLYFKPLLGDPSELLQTGPMTFAWRGMNMSLICFTKNDEGKNVMMIAGAYYEQTSNFGAILKRVFLIIALVFALSSVIIRNCFIDRDNYWQTNLADIIPRVIPMIGLGLLVWAVLNLLDVQNYTYKLAELDTDQFAYYDYFLGTSAFGIASIVSLFFSIRMFANRRNAGLHIIYYLQVFRLFFISGILMAEWLIGFGPGLLKKLSSSPTGESSNFLLNDLTLIIDMGPFTRL
jgi:hypothetical protein